MDYNLIAFTIIPSFSTFLFTPQTRAFRTSANPLAWDERSWGTSNCNVLNSSPLMHQSLTGGQYEEVALLTVLAVLPSKHQDITGAHIHCRRIQPPGTCRHTLGVIY